jgi:hypothetical protein
MKNFGLFFPFLLLGIQYGFAQEYSNNVSEEFVNPGTTSIDQIKVENSADQIMNSVSPERNRELNRAFIQQNGNELKAQQHQSGERNSAEIEQTGEFETASQIQESYSMDNRAKIYQSGAYNHSIQRQEGYWNDAEIYQDNLGWGGNNNYAEQLQSTAAIRTLSHDPINRAIIQQSGGMNNYGIQKQFSPGGDVPCNLAVLLQKGEQNYSEQYQCGQGNYSLTNQNGKCNKSLVIQENLAR